MRLVGKVPSPSQFSVVLREMLISISVVFSQAPAHAATSR